MPRWPEWCLSMKRPSAITACQVSNTLTDLLKPLKEPHCTRATSGPPQSEMTTCFVSWREPLTSVLQSSRYFVRTRHAKSFSSSCQIIFILMPSLSKPPHALKGCSMLVCLAQRSALAGQAHLRNCTLACAKFSGFCWC